MSGFGRRRQFGACAVSVAAVAMASAMSACSLLPGQSSDESPAPRRVSTYDEAQDAKAKAPAPAVPDARSGGTLHVLSSATPHTFDPTRVYHLDTLAIMRMVTRGLTQTRYVKGKPVLVPDLATDLGRPNADFTRWEFTLRDGVKYEDGSPVKSADVAYAIKRQLAQDELSGGPTYGLDYYLGGDSYKGPYKSGDDFEGVDTPDEKTIVVKMRKPFPSMRYYTSLPTFAPIPKAKDTRDDYGNHPLATGPYKFGSYDPGKKLVLVKNPAWDPKTDPNRHQYVDQMVFDFGLDTNEVQRRVIADRGEDQTALTYADILVRTTTRSGDRRPQAAGDRPQPVQQLHVDGHPEDPAGGAPGGGQGVAADLGKPRRRRDPRADLAPGHDDHAVGHTRLAGLRRGRQQGRG